MPPALRMISGRVTNPGATITALTANTGDSFQVQNFVNGRAYILQVWHKQGTLGVLRVRSPLLHDVAQAIRLRVPLVNKSRPLFPFAYTQPLIAQDTLTVEASGSAAATDAGSLLLYYEDLMGGYDSLISAQEADAREIHILGLEVPVTSGGTAGQYSGSVAINAGASAGVLKANTAYAILGYLTDTELASIGIQGPDLSNLRLGGPGSTDAYLTANYFYALSVLTGFPLIPVINSANAGNTTVDVVDTGTASTINITLILGQLTGAPPTPSLA